MQGLITLDFGNTNPHAGFFQKKLGTWNLIKVAPLNELLFCLSELNMTPHNTSFVLCEVKARVELIQDLENKGFLLTRVKDYWRGQKFAGMSVDYAKSLGEDRLIEAYHTFKHLRCPVLLINAGTFVTMDVVTQAGFLGGYIIPGIKAYLETYQNGEQLKNIPQSPPLSHKLPQNTSDAIGGSYGAFFALAKRLMSEHRIEKIVLTGGSHSLWKTFFEEEKLSLLVEVHEHLIHLALHYWMTTQIEPL
jgi:pantothenate kinase type III